MGHSQVLVIGPDFKDQIAKFQRAEYASPRNPHFVHVDKLAEAKAEYQAAFTFMLQHTDGSLHNETSEQFWRPVSGGKQFYVPEGYTRVRVPVQGNTTFAQWITGNYGGKIVAEGQVPDIDGIHQGGWMRLDARGEPCELIRREIPFGQWDWGESSEDNFPLKPGATGWNFDHVSGEKVLVKRRAGIATKGAINFAGTYQFPSAAYVLMSGNLFVKASYVGEHRLAEAHATPSVKIIPDDAWQSEMNAILRSLPDDTLLSYMLVHC